LVDKKIGFRIHEAEPGDSIVKVETLEGKGALILPACSNIHIVDLLYRGKTKHAGKNENTQIIELI
jgi:hypothetical protein